MIYGPWHSLAERLRLGCDSGALCDLLGYEAAISSVVGYQRFKGSVNTHVP
jgi:hypothetical protein